MGTPALSIKLRCASWQQLSVIYKRDLSRNTLFLKTQAPPPLGTVVRIDLTLPSETTVSMTGEVGAHVAATDSRGPGVDVKLAPLPPNALWLIESALAAEAKLRSESRPDVAPATPVAQLADRQDVGHAESELVAALQAEIESLRRLNPFQVLGLGYEASDGDVRAAFAELTKRYHPDRFARYQSAEPRRLAAEIFILIRDAYRKLGDAQARAATLQAIGRAGEPRAIPIIRTGSVSVMRPSPTTPAPSGAPPMVSRPSAPVAAPAPAAPAVGAVSRPGPVAPSSGSGLRPAPGAAPAAPRPPASAPRASSPALAPGSSASPGPPGRGISEVEVTNIEHLLDGGAYDDALAAYRSLAKRAPTDRFVRAGLELCAGLLALAAKERLEAAQHFESVLEIDPSNERAARQLAEMRRHATNERKGLLSRLMGKKE